MDYPVGNTWWLANFLWGHRCIWNGDTALWPSVGVWQGICTHLDAIFWPGKPDENPNWKILTSMLENAATIRLIGGPIWKDPLVSAHLPNGDVTRLGNAIGGCMGTTIVIDATRYTQGAFVASHEEGHCVAGIHGINTDPEVEAYFGKHGPSEEWAEAFARVVNSAGRSTAEVDFVRHILTKNGLI